MIKVRNHFLNSILLTIKNILAADMVKRFRVDGIPHLAFIDSNQEVKTALVGSIPKTVLKDEIVALLQVTMRFCQVALLLNCAYQLLLRNILLFVGQTDAL